VQKSNWNEHGMFFSLRFPYRVQEYDIIMSVQFVLQFLVSGNRRMFKRTKRSLQRASSAGLLAHQKDSTQFQMKMDFVPRQNLNTNSWQYSGCKQRNGNKELKKGHSEREISGMAFGNAKGNFNNCKPRLRFSLDNLSENWTLYRIYRGLKAVKSKVTEDACMNIHSY
jgi:hypothetical protein